MSDENETRDVNENVFDLEQFDEDFEAAEYDESAGGEGLPDGRYQMSVESAKLERSKAGNALLLWQMRVMAPHHAGRRHWHRNMLISAQNMKWLKRDLYTAGIRITKLSELPDHLQDFQDVLLEVQLKTRGENQNSFINKRLSAADVPDAPDDDGDDLAF